MYFVILKVTDFLLVIKIPSINIVLTTIFASGGHEIYILDAPKLLSEHRKNLIPNKEYVHRSMLSYYKLKDKHNTAN